MEQDKIWDVYQNNVELQQVGCRDGGRVEIVARLIPNGARILNIGVGKGTLEHLLALRNVEVYCLDPSEQSISQLRESLDLDDRARVGYSQDIPFGDKSFDYVVMTEVLEHLSDEVLKKTRSEIVRVLSKGGIFLGTVPADENLKDSFVVCPDCGKIFHRWGHLQSFSEERLNNYLIAEFKHVTVSRRAFSDWKSLNWKGRTMAAAKNIQARIGMRGSRQNFLFIAVK